MLFGWRRSEENQFVMLGRFWCWYCCREAMLVHTSCFSRAEYQLLHCARCVSSYNFLVNLLHFFLFLLVLLYFIFVCVCVFFLLFFVLSSSCTLHELTSFVASQLFNFLMLFCKFLCLQRNHFATCCLIASTYRLYICRHL